MKVSRHLVRALPLAAMMTLAAASTANAAGDPPVFHCNPGSNLDREAEIASIREEHLPALRNPSNPVGGRERRIAQYEARLKELELGAASCSELARVERGSQPRGTKAAPRRAPTPRPAVPALEDDSLIAPAEQPRPTSPLETDDLIAPAEPRRPSEAMETDDLIAPADDTPPSSPLETDDLIAPAEDLPTPAPKPAKPPAKPKRSTNPPMAPFPAPVGTPKFGGF